MMTFTERLKGAAIAIVILLFLVPLTVVIALFSIPMLDWFEGRFGIESIGHSGPAEWVYLTIYGILVVLAGMVWYLVRTKKRNI